MYQSGGTIKTLMDKVANKEYILPAIQREFVWGPEQIYQLFDSLLQGYPFGTFLFWKIEPNNRRKYAFYDFVQDYHARDKTHCERITPHKQEFVAVLDGQQRMTALNVGLRGSYSWKLARKRWMNDDAFPKRKLYLNLLGNPKDESGTKYQFDFLIEDQKTKCDHNQLWFRVSRVMDEDLIIFTDEIDHLARSEDNCLNENDRLKARNMMQVLHATIYNKDIISYYEEVNQDLEKVLNIFIRMNSGGTQLSYSDLLLSIAVTQWSSVDAREEIHSLVDEMNKVGYGGFDFSKDLVLKAGLMLSNIGSVGFKVKNFNKANMETLEKNWKSIKPAMMLATKLLATFGFNSKNLRADSAILPVAYYLYYRKLDEKYLSSSKYSEDRSNLRRWLIRSLLASGIWGSGLDTLLTGLRKVIVDHGQSSYPNKEIETLMAKGGKSLHFEDEEIEELSELEYVDPRTFSMLSLLFPGPDFSYEFNVDHIFPKSRFTKSKLGRLGFLDEETVDDLIDKSNRLPNLQLLERSINIGKSQKMPHEWIASQWPDLGARNKYLQMQAINELPEKLTGFETFYKKRRGTLKAKIRKVLND